MCKVVFIAGCEFKMQIKRAATWGVLAASVFIALLDNFPSESNLRRLEFLPDPSYFIYRIMSLEGLVLLFGLVFLLSGSLPYDKKTGIKEVFMSLPINKSQYAAGKLTGNFLYGITVVFIFLLLNTAVYAVFSLQKYSIIYYAVALLKTAIFLCIPSVFFISACSVALPGVMDIRLFYFIISALFIFNAMAVGSAEKMPFYLITSGDLAKLVWQHPQYPFSNGQSIFLNLLFLIGSGSVAIVFLLCSQKFWREE